MVFLLVTGQRQDIATQRLALKPHAKASEHCTAGTGSTAQVVQGKPEGRGLAELLYYKLVKKPLDPNSLTKTTCDLMKHLHSPNQDMNIKN